MHDFKTITGFDTPAEFEAYEKGREHEEAVLLKFIENWKGETNSLLGGLLARKVMESPVVSAASILYPELEFVLAQLRKICKHLPADIVGCEQLIKRVENTLALANEATKPFTTKDTKKWHKA